MAIALYPLHEFFAFRKRYHAIFSSKFQMPKHCNSNANTTHIMEHRVLQSTPQSQLLFYFYSNVTPLTNEVPRLLSRGIGLNLKKVNWPLSFHVELNERTTCVSLTENR